MSAQTVAKASRSTGFDGRRGRHLAATTAPTVKQASRMTMGIPMIGRYRIHRRAVPLRACLAASALGLKCRAIAATWLSSIGEPLVGRVRRRNPRRRSASQRGAPTAERRLRPVYPRKWHLAKSTVAAKKVLDTRFCTELASALPRAPATLRRFWREALATNAFAPGSQGCDAHVQVTRLCLAAACPP
jgi:hypothetical protein